LKLAEVGMSQRTEIFCGTELNVMHAQYLANIHIVKTQKLTSSVDKRATPADSIEWICLSIN